MTLHARLRKLAAECRATTSLEFAFVGGMTVFATFGTIDLGMLLWTQNALQSAAALAARCAAMTQLPPLCASVPTYAANLANSWTMPGMVSAGNVSVTNVAACNGANGAFRQVTITATFWADRLPPPFHGRTVTGSACYPT